MLYLEEGKRKTERKNFLSEETFEKRESDVGHEKMPAEGHAIRLVPLSSGEKGPAQLVASISG